VTAYNGIRVFQISNYNKYTRFCGNERREEKMIIPPKSELIKFCIHLTHAFFENKIHTKIYDNVREFFRVEDDNKSSSTRDEHKDST
jgi:hypothetical protein